MANNLRRKSDVRTRWSVIFTISLLLAAATPARAVDIRILLIGSSHSAGIKAKLQRILGSVGLTYTVTAKTCNGCSLSDHAVRSTTLDAIDEGWDWVVLQDNAKESFEYVGWDAAKALGDRAQAANPAGAVMFYMIFPQLPAFREPSYYAYELGRLRHDACLDQDVCPPQSPAGCLGRCYGYAAIGHQMGIRIAPVGQSVVDFHEESGLPISSIFGSGGGHLNDKGDYLVALTMYTTIFESLPERVWAPTGLTPSQAATYKSIARNAVLREPAVWNL